MNFGRRLRKLRENKKITQKELSKILNVSESTIGMYERGEREPNFETVNKIASFFNVSTDYLLGRIAIDNIETDNIETDTAIQVAEQDNILYDQLPEVQFIMRAKEKMSPKAYAKFIELTKKTAEMFTDEEDEQ